MRYRPSNLPYIECALPVVNETYCRITNTCWNPETGEYWGPIAKDAGGDFGTAGLPHCQNTICLLKMMNN
jgi:hypothetical protein